MFDPTLLRTFLAVAGTRSFTQAAQRLGVRQSTVSQHVRKLEAAAGQQLFLRDTHSVELTADGEAMVGFAHGILRAHERAANYFARSDLRGRVRFGTSEDFVLSRLPEILREFRRSHPLISVELTVGLSGTLHEQLRDGELDLVFGKRRPGQTHGQLVWREPLVWIAAEDFSLDPAQPIPLILYPPPSISRVQALDALQRHGQSWRITCTSASLSGLRAAALAGLGITAHARSLIPPGLAPLRPRRGLPELGEVEFVLLGDASRGPAGALAAAIRGGAERLHQPMT
ncbi:LysR substrate-binding domain-containing protein [Saccharopolyspora rosea]|uniref:LysR substrate-binding domain-containing protein n=1 Tax=Saccharopolyspora rosea TaxID=524884 RepID=A0ABW3G1Z9_9PSEU|nr:LysR substrate-binding domain-containing protein [Saccharopolyspora rosea]